LKGNLDAKAGLEKRKRLHRGWGRGRAERERAISKPPYHFQEKALLQRRITAGIHRTARKGVWAFVRSLRKGVRNTARLKGLPELEGEVGRVAGDP